MHDARGIAEPLERYGELMASQIVGLCICARNSRALISTFSASFYLSRF
jgi:hypothetical protein